MLVSRPRIMDVAPQNALASIKAKAKDVALAQG